MPRWGVWLAADLSEGGAWALYRERVRRFASLIGDRKPVVLLRPLPAMGKAKPVGHVIHQVITKPFIDAIEKRTNGAVSISHFPAEQLGKANDLLRLTQAGVADIAYIVPSYTSDKMPLSAVAELPGNTRDACEGTAAYWALTRDQKILADREYAPNGIRPLVAFLLPTYQFLLATRKPVSAIGDLAGLKLRTVGGALDSPAARDSLGVNVALGGCILLHRLVHDQNLWIERDRQRR